MPTAPTPVLSTDRLRLEAIERAHAIALAAALEDPALYAFIGGSPPSVAELESRIQRWLAGSPRPDETWHNWAIRLAGSGEVVGHVQATVTEGGSEADMAWMVGSSWQGAGYATEAAVAVRDWLRSRGAHAISANVHPANVASERVAERVGLRPTAALIDGERVWRWTAVELPPAG